MCQIVIFTIMRKLLYISLLLVTSMMLPQVSLNNSTYTPLTGTDTVFVGNSTVVNSYKSITFKVLTDRDGLLYCDFSPDNLFWYSLPPYEVDSGKTEVHQLEITSKHQRTRFVNTSGEDQSYLYLETRYGNNTSLTNPLNFTVGNDADATVVKSVSEEILFIENKFDGYRLISKYGINIDVDAAEDIWDGGGDYTGFPTTSAEEFQALSTDTDDSNGGNGANTIRVFYLDDDYNMFDNNGGYLYFDLDLNGTTPVNSGITGMRIWRVKVIDSGSSGSNEGDITVRWRTTTSVIFTVIRSGYGQTEISSFTVPSGYKAHLKRYSASMDDNTSNSAIVAIKVRDFGTNTFRLTRPFSISTTKNKTENLYGAETYPEKTDIVFRCTSIANANGIINVDFGILLSKQ